MILVTGCAGFVGRRVSELLVQEGHTVLGVDNLNDAYDVRAKQWRLEQLQRQPNFSFQCINITDRSVLTNLFERKSDIPASRGKSQRPDDTTPAAGTPPVFDAVINLAARAGVRQSLQDPWAYFETNVTGTLNLLEMCREVGVAKFILASTSSVYGDTNEPCHEEMPADRPLSPYTASKKAAESLCYTYHRQYGLDVTVLRYFSVYGPAGRPDMSIFRFVKWINEDEPVILYGDGTQQRDFTFVDDIARGTFLALKPVGYEIINLGSGKPVNLLQVIAQLEQLLDKKASVDHHVAHSADVSATWADIGKARAVLGWEPVTALGPGLGQTVAWFQQNRAWAKDIRL